MSKEKQKVAKVFEQIAEGLASGNFAVKTPIGLTVLGSEHGEAELIKAAKIARDKFPTIEITLIGGEAQEGFKHHSAATLEESHKIMENLLASGEIKGCVSLHYNFPLGVSTVGKVTTPALGKDMIMATTTGTTDPNRYIAMIKNAIAGIATAKATGINEPTVGILNIDGASAVGKLLCRLKDNGFPITFAESARADGGISMRGNDLLQGTPDIMVADTLTGNLLIKMFSSFTTGGGYEAHGFGYGPGIGKGYKQLVNIISRASGAPVIANAIGFCGECAKNDVFSIYNKLMAQAESAGLNEFIMDLPGMRKEESSSEENVPSPPEKVANEDISGIDILEIEDARISLWKENVFAKTGMGCTGPIVMVAADDLENAKEILKKNNFI